MTAFEDSRLFTYHHGLLADAPRVEAYRAAIEHAVKPGAVVVDMGAGTGLLSILACRAGAARVYAIEGGPIASLASEFLQANGVADRVVLVRGVSTEVSLPERADVLVTETLGSAGLDERILEYVIDARTRFLREGAGPEAIVPRAMRLLLAPVDASERYAHRVGRWGATLAGLDVSPALKWAVEQPASEDFRASELAALPAVLAQIDLATVTSPFVRGTARFVFEAPRTLHGLALWFEADLTERHSLCNAPAGSEASPIASHWSQTYLPFPTPIAATPGDDLTVQFESHNGQVFRWSGSLGAARFDQCSLFGSAKGRALPLPSKPG